MNQSLTPPDSKSTGKSLNFKGKEILAIHFEMNNQRNIGRGKIAIRQVGRVGFEPT